MTADSQPPSPPPPWGFWPSLGFTFLSVVTIFVIQTAVAIVFIFAVHAQQPELTMEQLQERVQASGTAVALSALLSTPVAIGAVALFVWLRRGSCLQSYLGLDKPKLRPVLLWSLAVLLLIALSDFVTYCLGHDVSPSVMVQLYRNTTGRALLWLAFVVAAPLTEETLFRGFLFRGLAASHVGPFGAILFSASLWAGIHIQYESYDMLVILVFGMFLGVARWRTGSLTLCMLLHGLMNIVATAEAHYFAQAG